MATREPRPDLDGRRRHPGASPTPAAAARIALFDSPTKPPSSMPGFAAVKTASLAMAPGHRRTHTTIGSIQHPRGPELPAPVRRAKRTASRRPSPRVTTATTVRSATPAGSPVAMLRRHPVRGRLRRSLDRRTEASSRCPGAASKSEPRRPSIPGSARAARSPHAGGEIERHARPWQAAAPEHRGRGCRSRPWPSAGDETSGSPRNPRQANTRRPPMRPAARGRRRRPDANAQEVSAAQRRNRPSPTPTPAPTVVRSSETNVAPTIAIGTARRGSSPPQGSGIRQ